MLETHCLTKVYRSARRKYWFGPHERKDVVAVSDVNLTINPGEVVALLGLNGAGKTTLVKMLCTLLLPTAGTVTIDGLDIIRDATAVRQRVNMVAGGQRMLYMQLTTQENLRYFGDLYNVDANILPKRIIELLELVGLKNQTDVPVEKFSTGMKQRLQMARGLINDPSYLFLDEPTLGLDVPIARDLRQFVRQLARERGKGILLTTHNMSEAEELSDRIYVIYKGQIIEAGTPASIKQKFGNISKLVLLLSKHDDTLDQILTQLREHYSIEVSTKDVSDGVEVTICVPVQTPTSEIIHTLINAQCDIVRFSHIELSLEDVIFGQIMKGDRE
jgi:ABC-2 type transport system ATP-binding protein